MGVRDQRSGVRAAVIAVVLLLHGSVLLVLLRMKSADAARSASAPLLLLLIGPEHRVALPVVETPGTARPSRSALEPHRHPDSATPGGEKNKMLEEPGSAAEATIDWSAEAAHSAADIAEREGLDPSTLDSTTPVNPAPWDPHPHLLESTGHGLKLRIPVKIPWKIIDHCYSDIDLGQTAYGPEERLQLGCALKKQPARGDLFESLRKPQPTK